MLGVIIDDARPGIVYCRYCKWSIDVDVDSDDAALKALVEANKTDGLAKRSMIKLRITDEAWSWIIQTAQRLNYLTGTKNARGVSRFLADLSMYDFVDTREDFLQGTDQWYASCDAPRQRAVDMPSDVKLAYIELANKHEIFPYPLQQAVINGYYAKLPENLRVSAASRYSTASRISPVLEAIGLRWLVEVGQLSRADPLVENLHRQQALRKAQQQQGALA